MRPARLVSLAVGALLALSCTVVRTVDPLELRLTRESVFDGFLRFSPRAYRPLGVRIVDIDEASLAEIGQWPWPRSDLARLLQRLRELGAAVVAFDMVFPEPDRMSPSQLVLRQDLRAAIGPAIAEQFAGRLPDNDAEFARAIADMPTVLGFGALPGVNMHRPAAKAALAATGHDPRDILPFFAAAVVNLPGLNTVARGVGAITLSPLDQQGIVRRIPLVWSDGERVYPGLVLETLRVYEKEANILIHVTDDPPFAVTGLRVGRFEIPTTGDGEMRLRFSPDTRDRYIPASHILSGEQAALRERVEGHMVLIGTSATGLFDARTTPLAETVPGVSVHAQALEQIFAGEHLLRPDWVNGLEIGWSLVFAIIIVVVATFMPPMTAFLLGGIMALATLATAGVAFSQWGLLLDPVFPSLVGLMLYFVLISLRFFVTDRDRLFIQRAFSRYLAPSVLNEVLRNPAALQLGGEECELTILFMDVRDFTATSEQLTPTEVVNFLNILLGELTRDILVEGGTIDKYIGDSIMAFWNAPLKVQDHAARACRAALRMRSTLQDLNARDAFHFRQRPQALPDVRIGIGINTGPSLVGNMGSEIRFNYSAVGDAVNVASRIESLAKTVGAEIIVSSSVLQSARGLACLGAGAFGLRGRAETTETHVLVGDENVAASPEFRHLYRVHMDLLAAARSRSSDWRSLLLECSAIADQSFPELRSFYEALPDRVLSSIGPNEPVSGLGRR